MSNYIPIQNKYYMWYTNICHKAKTRKLDKTKLTYYTEKHHIVPHSLNGSNESKNLVLLTAKEHFICHLLLPKFYENDAKYKMLYALRCLCLMHSKRQHRYRITSKIFENLRIELSFPKSTSHKQAISNAHKGKKKSKTHCANIATALKVSPNNKRENNPFYGKTHSNEVRAIIKEKRKLQITTPETREKMKQSHLKRWAIKKAINEM